VNRSGPRFRHPVRMALIQGLSFGLGAAALWWLGHNAALSLERRGITVGFGFLHQPANFDIGDTPLAFAPTDSLGRAIVVGLFNTLRVSVAGWILSLALGFGLGALRLAENPAVRGAARLVVELIRNVPLLLLLLFFAAVMHGLPSAQHALHPLPGVFLSDRGLVLPKPVLGAGPLLLLLLLAIVMLGRRRLGRLGWPVAGAGTIAFLVWCIIAPIRWEVPSLREFNYLGGWSLSPELTALLIALTLHHGAHISEVVRGAILAVPRGQTDAAVALGMTRLQLLRLVIVPQALRAMVPLLATACVSLTKNSSLAVAIGFPDLVSVLNTTSNQTGHALETMLIMIAVYLGLSLVVAAALNGYNARLLSRGARTA
jgi:general L-amino acid transport system permease protein